MDILQGFSHLLEAQIVRLDDVVMDLPALHAVRRRPNRVAERFEGIRRLMENSGIVICAPF
jgi:hypothetical protein